MRCMRNTTKIPASVLSLLTGADTRPRSEEYVPCDGGRVRRAGRPRAARSFAEAVYGYDPHAE